MAVRMVKAKSMTKSVAKSAARSMAMVIVFSVANDLAFDGFLMPSIIYRNLGKAVEL